MGTYSGYTPETAKSLLLDAGAFFKNFYVGVDTFQSAVADGKLLGATSGGGAFSAIPTLRPIPIDGVKGTAKGLQVIDEWVITLTANVKEVKKATIQTALATSDVDTASNSDYDIITAQNQIVLTDYIDNITWVGNLSGTNDPIIIQVYNALNTSGLTLNVADKAEAVLALSFTGHYIDTDLDTPPFKIYYPKAITNTVDDAEHTFSKAAAADIVLTITSSDGAVCGGVSNGTQHLVSTAYTLGSGTVTLEKEYLGTLTNAAYTFYLLMDKGNNIAVDVTVGA
jgi:hypothetical protein